MLVKLGLIGLTGCLLVFTTIVWVGGAGAQASAAGKACGDIVKEGSGVYNVHAENASCSRARNIARRWQANCDVLQPCIVAGFVCQARKVGNELWKVRCRTESQAVRFDYGAAPHGRNAVSPVPTFRP